MDQNRRIKIFAALPCDIAPPWVGEAWIDMELPIQEEDEHNYVVDAYKAFQLLRLKNKDAYNWYDGEEIVGEWRRIVFPKSVCCELSAAA